MSGEVLAEVEEALDKALASLDASLLTDGEIVEAIDRLRRITNKLDAADARVVHAADSRRVCEEFASRSTVAWLAWRCKSSRGLARRRVAIARLLPHLPDLERAMVDGTVGADHAGVLANLDSMPTRDDLVRTHRLLVDDAAGLGYRDFVRACAWWLRLADPDRAERSDQAMRDKRGLTLSETTGGYHLSGWLTTLAGRSIVDLLRPFEDVEFEADWAAAKADHGDDASLADLPRTAAQRRADALLAALTAAGTAPADGQPPRPVGNIVVDFQTFADEMRRRAGLPVDPSDPGEYRTRACCTVGGQPVAPADAIEHLLRGWIRRVVIDPENVITDASARQRLFRGPLAEILRHIYGSFTAPGCELPAELSDIDHVTPHGEGGITNAANGRPLCRHHNQLKNRGWRTTRPPGNTGTTWWHPDGHQLE